MKISLNGMIYENSHKSMDQGFRNNGSSNHETFKRKLYVIKKNQNTAKEFSSLILNEFKGQKLNHAHGYTTTPVKSMTYTETSSLNRDETSAVNFLNEYWA